MCMDVSIDTGIVGLEIVCRCAQECVIKKMCMRIVENFVGNPSTIKSQSINVADSPNIAINYSHPDV